MAASRRASRTPRSRSALATGAAGFWHARGEKLRRPRLNGWEWGAVILFALFALRAFLWLVFFDGDNIKVLSPNNLGDLSLHLTYIREVANGVPFWPDNPIFAHTKLSYPIGVDLLHSLIVLCGGDVIARSSGWGSPAPRSPA